MNEPKIVGMICGGVVGAVLLCILGVTYHGFVAAQLFNWFVAPILQVPPIGIVHAIGLGLFIWYFIIIKISDVEDEDEEPARKMIFTVLKPTLFLFMGWIVSRML